MLLRDIWNLADAHQGGVAIIIFVLGLVFSMAGFLVKRLFSGNESVIKQKQKSGDNSSNIQIGSFNIRSDDGKDKTK